MELALGAPVRSRAVCAADEAERQAALPQSPAGRDSSDRSRVGVVTEWQRRDGIGVIRSAGQRYRVERAEIFDVLNLTTGHRVQFELSGDEARNIRCLVSPAAVPRLKATRRGGRRVRERRAKRSMADRGPTRRIFFWLPPRKWTCPRCLASLQTVLAGPRCVRCGYVEGA